MEYFQVNQHFQEQINMGNVAVNLYKSYKQIQSVVFELGKGIDYIMDNTPDEIKLLGEID